MDHIVKFEDGPDYNLDKDPSPFYFSNNKSRNHFLYSPYFHEKGKHFQFFIKGLMIKFLENCQFKIEDTNLLNHLNSEIDKVCTREKQNRLLKLAANIIVKHIEDPSVAKSLKMFAARKVALQVRKEIINYDNDAFTFDDDRLQRIQEKTIPEKLLSDILLFLLKEDIYYRARFFDLSQNLKTTSHTGSFADIFNLIISMDFELTEAEINNIKRFS